MLTALPEVRQRPVRDATRRAFAAAREGIVAPAPGRRPVSVLSLFRVLLAIRWLILLPLPLQTVVGTAPPGNWRAWAAIVLAVVYTLILTLFSKRFLELHLRSYALVFMDVAVCTLLYSTGQGTSWPFFLFSTTTMLIPALYGRVAVGLGAAILWNVITIVVQWSRGVPLAVVFGIPAIEDLFNVSMVAAAWAYSIGLTTRLNIAYEELLRNRAELESTGARLDDREHEILCVLAVGEALLLGRDAEQIMVIVSETLDRMDFGRSSVWLLEDGHMRAARPEVAKEAPEGRIPETVLRALNLTETVLRRPEGEPVPGLDDHALGAIVPIVGRDSVMGVLIVQSVAGFWTQEELEILRLFAEQTALGMEHVSFEQQSRELAAAAEHDRITLEIHDGVTQKVYGAALLAEKLVDSENGSARASLEAIRRLIVRSHEDLQLVVLDWQSLEWQDPLPRRAEHYAERFEAITGIETSVRCSGGDGAISLAASRDVTRRLGQALYASRRRGATWMRALLELDTPGVELVVDDDVSDGALAPDSA